MSAISNIQAEAISNVVRSIMIDGHPADKSLQFYFRNHRLTEEFDRGIIAETVYEIIRWWRLLLELDGEYPAIKEIDFLRILAIYCAINDKPIPENPQLRSFNKEKFIAEVEHVSRFRKIKQSIPDWLDTAGYAAFGAEWEDELKALNQTPPIFIRTNRLKIKPVELSIKLAKQGFENVLVDKVPDAIMLKSRQNIFQSALFLDGFFEVQDAGSQLIVPMLEVKPGMRVVDACAGNGGKSLHIAAQMQNKGKIIAMDTRDDRLKTLRARSTRAGVDIIETKIIENSKSVKRLAETADRLLLDVPCSGTGSIRRNPELKWRIDPAKIAKLKQTQREILFNYSQVVKPGGILVYSTCSILPEENNEQVDGFINKTKGRFELLKEQSISPAKTGFDGFYIAQLRKK
jgi:16S rRNA (cytosine967-C5)-methyltransferase